MQIHLRFFYPLEWDPVLSYTKVQFVPVANPVCFFKHWRKSSYSTLISSRQHENYLESSRQINWTLFRTEIGLHKPFGNLSKGRASNTSSDTKGLIPPTPLPEPLFVLLPHYNWIHCEFSLWEIQVRFFFRKVLPVYVYVHISPSPSADAEDVLMQPWWSLLWLSLFQKRSCISGAKLW